MDDLCDDPLVFDHAVALVAALEEMVTGKLYGTKHLKALTAAAAFASFRNEFDRERLAALREASKN